MTSNPGLSKLPGLAFATLAATGATIAITLAQLVQHAGRWAGCERPIFPLPT